MPSLDRRLAGGDRRSIGQADEVAAEVLATPALFAELYAAIGSQDPIVRMRAADAVEKVSRERPELLAPFKKQVLGELSQVTQPEVRWHFCQIVTRLDLTHHEAQTAFDQLVAALRDDSRIVQACAVQGLADLARREKSLRREAVTTIKAAIDNGGPAVRARGRKVLAELASV